MSVLSQFSSDRLVRKASSVTAANRLSGSPSVVSVWTDMWTLGVLQKQESEGEEAPLAGWAGRERDAPAGERRSTLEMQGPRAEHCSAATLEVVAGCAASSRRGLSST